MSARSATRPRSLRICRSERWRRLASQFRTLRESASLHNHHGGPLGLGIWKHQTIGHQRSAQLGILPARGIHTRPRLQRKRHRHHPRIRRRVEIGSCGDFLPANKSRDSAHRCLQRHGNDIFHGLIQLVAELDAINRWDIHGALHIHAGRGRCGCHDLASLCESNTGLLFHRGIRTGGEHKRGRIPHLDGTKLGGDLFVDGGRGLLCSGAL